jgi:hypothetical protein
VPARREAPAPAPPPAARAPSRSLSREQGARRCSRRRQDRAQVAKAAPVEAPAALEAPPSPAPPARSAAPVPATLTASAAKEATKTSPASCSDRLLPRPRRGRAYAAPSRRRRPRWWSRSCRARAPGNRVRVGDFRAFKDAVDAKAQFREALQQDRLVVGPL